MTWPTASDTRQRRAEMGLTFTVGNPCDAFIEPHAGQVRSILLRHFGEAIDLDAEGDPYFSEELAWSGWEQLQQRAAQAAGTSGVSHLLSMEAWCGCFVPVETEPVAFEFEGDTTPLSVASLPMLLRELEAVGTRSGLRTDETGLQELVWKYQADDLADEDMDLQTYAQLLLAARVAQVRRQVLWVVK
jgi:hypothetical protein